MIRLRLSYQCFNGENNTKSIKVVSGIYKNVPVNLEFRLPDGSPFVPEQQLMLDDNGKAEYLIPRELLYQNGTVLAQASVSLSDGRVEKSSIISFPVVQSINATDDFTILLKNNRLYSYSGNTLKCVGDNANYSLKFEGINGLSPVFAIFRKDGKASAPIQLDEFGCAKIPVWVLKEGYFEVGLQAEGFASAPIQIAVDRSIIEKTDLTIDDSRTDYGFIVPRLVTTLSSESTDREVPSAKCVYDTIVSAIRTALSDRYQ